MKIIHVDTGKEWRGGQRQCYLLHTGLLNRHIDSNLICLRGSAFDNKNVDKSISFNFGGEINPLSALRLGCLIKAYNPDIVHSHDAHSLTPLLILKLLGAKFQLVHTRRVDFSVNKNRLSLYKYKNKFINLVAISEGVKKILVNDGINGDNIKVIYSGVPGPAKPSPDDVSSLKRAFGLESGTVFGTVANFSPHKDLYTMLKAFAEYLPNKPDSKLLMVGNGPLYNDIVDFAKQLNIQDNTIFTGFRTDIPQLMACMDIFLVSSEFEGLNTSIIDAMHMSLPVIATDAGGIGELVENGVNGFLCPVKDYKAIAVQMQLLATSHDLQKKFSAASSAKAIHFTDDAMVENYISYYKGLLR